MNYSTSPRPKPGGTIERFRKNGKCPKCPSRGCAVVFSRRHAPEVCEIFSFALQSEGAGKAGCALHPRSRVQIAREVRTRAYRAAGNTRPSLRNGFTAYNALTPEYRALLASVASRKMARRPGWALAPPQDLTPTTEASGRHVFAVRFGAVRPHAARSLTDLPTRPATTCAPDAIASTASPPRVCDVRETPLLMGRDGWEYSLSRPSEKQKYF